MCTVCSLLYTPIGNLDCNYFFRSLEEGIETEKLDLMGGLLFEPLLQCFDQQIDTPSPERKAQWLENENEAKSRCQRERQKVPQWLCHGHTIGVRHSLSRAL